MCHSDNSKQELWENRQQLQTAISPPDVFQPELKTENFPLDSQEHSAVGATEFLLEALG